MRLLDGALIQAGWCPYKKRGTRGVHAQRKSRVRTQREGGHLQGRKRAHTRNQIGRHLDPGLLTSTTVKK